MIFKHIETIGEDLDLLNKMCQTNGTHIFIIVFMTGCGPCIETLKAWKPIENKLRNEYKSSNNIMVVAVNKDLLDHIKFVGKVEGFPTIKYINNNNNNLEIENYEDSKIVTKNRSTSSFINWIENSIKRYKSVPHDNYRPTKKHTSHKPRNHRGGNSKRKKRKSTKKRKIIRKHTNSDPSNFKDSKIHEVPEYH